MAERESTSTRQSNYLNALADARQLLARKYRGTSSSGSNVWPFSRRIRRQMEHDMAKREVGRR